MIATQEGCLELCQKMLREERSAVKTYNKVIEKFSSEPSAPELQRIRSEHQQSVTRLDQLVRNLGGDPDPGSGSWGVFASAIQQAANLFGEESAIQALHLGEKKILSDYEDALNSGELAPEQASVYRGTLAPQIRTHLAALAVLEQGAA